MSIVHMLTIALVATTFANGLNVDLDPDYLYVDEDVGNTEELNPTDEVVHARWKRSTTTNDPGWKLPDSHMLRRARKLLNDSGYKNLAHNLKQAITEGNFSKLTPKDIDDVSNVTILEYIPSKVFEQVNTSLLTSFVHKFVHNNRPMALGRLIEATGDKLNTTYLIDRIIRNGGIKDDNEVATSILLYTAVKKVDKNGLTKDLVLRLVHDHLLGFVSDEQLLKVKDVDTAKLLLNSLAQSPNKGERTSYIANKALTFELVRTVYGSTVNWTQETLRNVGSNINVLPAAVLKLLKPEPVIRFIQQLSEAKFETPLQGKSITDIYLQRNIIAKNQDGIGNPDHISRVTRDLGRLSAFLPGGITTNSTFLTNIVSSCEKFNLPAPLKAISSYYEGKLRGGTNPSTKLTNLKPIEFQRIPASILKFSPPEVLKIGIAEHNSITQDGLKNIGEADSTSKFGKTKISVFQGVLSQLGTYAVQTFVGSGSRGKIDYTKFPAAFYGALNISEFDKLQGNNIDIITNNLKEYPDTFDDVQKALLMKKLKDTGAGQDVTIPPELLSLRSRKKNELIQPNTLTDLPWNSELRLAFASAERTITLYELKKSPFLLGTLTPSQIERIQVDDIPSVMSIIRKSNDGPQPQALKSLYLRFADYIRLKADDYDSDKAKLLKYITAAEITKLPATVLAYFIHTKHTARLPDAVRKEILVALGELSAKDYATIPRKTRQEIVSQGLTALEKSLSANQNYSAVELAAIGRGVLDLPPDKIKRLAPEALELALEVIQGINDDLMKYRPCLETEQRNAWREAFLSNYGQPESWDPVTISTLCCSLELLNEDDLIKVHKDGIVTCKCVSDIKPPSHLAELKSALDTACKHDVGNSFQTSKNVFEKIKSERSLDVDNFESQVFGRSSKTRDTQSQAQGLHHTGDSHLLNCYALRLMGSAEAFDFKTLETLPPNEMNNCLYELGVSKLPQGKAQLLWQKLVKSWDDAVEKIPPQNLRNGNNILSGITEGEILKLNFLDADVISAFGRPLGLSMNVLKKMSTHLEDKTKYLLDRFKAKDLIVARNILCGFDKEKLATINPTDFREALPVLKDLEPTCEHSKLSTLANIAIQPAVFGDPSRWDAADVRGIGILLKGLATAHAKKIPAEAFLGVTPTVAQALTSDTLRELSPEQLGFIPQFSAQALTIEQINSLTSQGKEALDSLIRGPLVTSNSVKLQIYTTTLVFTTFTIIAAHKIL